MLAAIGSRTLLSIAALGISLAGSGTASAQLAGDPPLGDQAAPPEPPPPPPPAAAPGGLKIEANGASLRLGFLAQPAFEYQSQTFGSTLSQSSFFLRRIRLMAGMTVGSSLEFFFETDSPNLGKPASRTVLGMTEQLTGVGNTSGTLVQDAFVTWKAMDELKIDGGQMLIPFSHNSVQGATTLYAWDYFASSFLQSGGYQNFAGRDVGVQFRGLLIGHLEYRLGVFTGKRGIPAPPPPPMMAPAPPSQAILRLAGRVQYNVFDPETAYFYAGTYGGAKKILSFGAGFDHQDSFNAFAVDAFLDWPVGNDVVTAQAAFMHFNGGTWMPISLGVPGAVAAKKVSAIVVEAGYRVSQMKLSPILRFENQSASQDPVAGMAVATPDVLRFSAGVAMWLMNHTANIKAFYSYVKPDNSVFKTFNQLNVQVQFYVF